MTHFVQKFLLPWAFTKMECLTTSTKQVWKNWWGFLMPLGTSIMTKGFHISSASKGWHFWCTRSPHSDKPRGWKINHQWLYLRLSCFSIWINLNLRNVIYALWGMRLEVWLTWLVGTRMISGFGRIDDVLYGWNFPGFEANANIFEAIIIVPNSIYWNTKFILIHWLTEPTY